MNFKTENRRFCSPDDHHQAQRIGQEFDGALGCRRRRKARIERACLARRRRTDGRGEGRELDGRFRRRRVHRLAVELIDQAQSAVRFAVPLPDLVMQAARRAAARARRRGSASNRVPRVSGSGRPRQSRAGAPDAAVSRSRRRCGQCFPCSAGSRVRQGRCGIF